MADDALRAFFHPRDAAGAGDRFRRLGALADGEVATGERRLRRRDGGWRWLAGRETVFARSGDGAQAAPADKDEDPGLFGVGLVGRREPMRHLGGRLTVGPADPRGTVVEASLPIDSALGSGEGLPWPRPSVAEPA